VESILELERHREGLAGRGNGDLDGELGNPDRALGLESGRFRVPGAAAGEARHNHSRNGAHAPRIVLVNGRLGKMEVSLKQLSGSQRCHLAQDPIESGALDELHGVVGHAVVLAEGVHRHDVRVVERGGGAGLEAEAIEVGAVAAVLEGEDLERHPPPQGLLHGLVDHAHAAAADLPQDPVSPEPLEAGCRS
jgi:hypothetical protein